MTDRGNLKIVRLGSHHRLALAKFLKELDSRTTYYYTHLGYKISKPAEEADKILQGIADGRTLGYILLRKKEIIGFGHFDLFPRKEKEHVAKLGIVMHRRYQSRGLGKKLLDQMIAHAKMIGIEKIWLATYADNPRSIELYSSRGFLVEGVFQKEEKVHGRYRNVMSMALFLKNDRRS
jgi:RimJ/RimL family protein N-acetyltransferase